MSRKIRGTERSYTLGYNERFHFGLRLLYLKSKLWLFWKQAHRIKSGCMVQEMNTSTCVTLLDTFCCKISAGILWCSCPCTGLNFKNIPKKWAVIKYKIFTIKMLNIFLRSPSRCVYNHTNILTYQSDTSKFCVLLWRTGYMFRFYLSHLQVSYICLINIHIEVCARNGIPCGLEFYNKNI
jgi:hypothetical protein